MDNWPIYTSEANLQEAELSQQSAVCDRMKLFSGECFTCTTAKLTRHDTDHGHVNFKPLYLNSVSDMKGFFTFM